MERCRLCARESADLVSLTGNMEKKIGRLMPVVVFLGDMLPQGICSYCQKRLDEFSTFCEEAKRAERFFLLKLPYNVDENKRAVSHPMVTLHDTHEEIFTVAYKAFMNINQPDPLLNFDKNNICGTALFSCKTCKAIYVSKKAALSHICKKSESLPLKNVENELSERVPEVIEPETVPSCLPNQTEPCLKPPSEIIPTKKAKRRRKTFKVANKCHICELVCQNESELSFHFEKHFIGPSITTSSTQFPVSHPMTFDGHSARRHLCEICHQSFTRKSALLTHHQKTHTIQENTLWSDDGF